MNAKHRERVEREATEYALSTEYRATYDRARLFEGYCAGAESEHKRASEILVTELKRMHHCVWASLADATAFMGIPDHKRDKFIKDHASNADFILNEALKKWSEGE